MKFRHLAQMGLGSILALASALIALGSLPMALEAFEIMQTLGAQGPFLNSAFVISLCLLFIVIGVRLARSAWRTHSLRPS